MARGRCKHSRIIPNKAERKLFPLLGMSFPWASVCLVYGLGRGGLGSVYLAEECRGGSATSGVTIPRLYAVKVVRTRNRHAKLPARLRKEYKLHSGLVAHPNIVQIYSFHETADATITFLEYAREGDVYNLLANYGAIIARDNSLIKIIFLQILDAVVHIHRQGIYHCDIKPENLLCKQEGDVVRVLLADFGCSVNKSIIYNYGGYCNGTDLYLSPGKPFPFFSLLNRRYSHCDLSECLPPTVSIITLPDATDIWALGVCLYNLCSGGFIPWSLASIAYDKYYRFYLSDPALFFVSSRIAPTIQDVLKMTWDENMWVRRHFGVAALRQQIESIDEFTRYPDAQEVLQRYWKQLQHPLLSAAAWQRGRCAGDLKLQQPSRATCKRSQSNGGVQPTYSGVDLDLETQEAALLALALSAQLEINAS